MNLEIDKPKPKLEDFKHVIEKVDQFMDFQFSVVLHPLGYRTGYVEIPQKLIQKVQEVIPEIACHGGISYAGFGLPTKEFADEGVKIGYFIGFDCNSATDKPDYDSLKKYHGQLSEAHLLMKKQNKELLANAHVWSKNEVEDECKKVIREIYRLIM